ncbi:hypothetical protein TESG_03127 [Trichophyton tonsurans CBS 112818]|uniref:Uncharacterized protein n=1 Tax=Trichophyton tonsurans (strain CBS 112818) TaxID=647933 RepID=F2RWI5_TRIT1|nr:hypothetical protein TESG_03127 [Trichophyton tonsurans CBS 112818]
MLVGVEEDRRRKKEDIRGRRRRRRMEEVEVEGEVKRRRRRRRREDKRRELPAQRVSSLVDPDDGRWRRRDETRRDDGKRVDARRWRVTSCCHTVLVGERSTAAWPSMAQRALPDRANHPGTCLAQLQRDEDALSRGLRTGRRWTEGDAYADTDTDACDDDATDATED